MVSSLLVIFYTIIFTVILVKISRSYRNYLSAQQVGWGFITKIIFGMAYGVLFWKFYHGDDTWQYHEYSLIEYQSLLHHPAEFFRDIGVKANGSSSLEAIYDTTNSFWNKLDDVLFIKLLTIFNLFSFGNYYVNVVLFCFPVYLGHLLLYRLLVRRYPKAADAFIAAVFYNPMIMFWLSGIRKEGIIFVALVMVLYYFDRLVKRSGRTFVNLIVVVAGLSLLMIMRNFVVMCLVPALVAWVISRFFKRNAASIFLVAYTGCIILFFMSGNIPGLPDLPAKVTQRQHDFLSLRAKTRLPIDSLKGTASSFLKVLPQAINHSFLRPYLTESKGVLQLFSAADVVLFYMLAILTVFFRKPEWQKVFKDPLLLSLLFTSVFGFLLIGYTVPFPGTFVRYKSIFELLFLCVFAATIDPESVRRFLLLIKINISRFSR